ncbi:MAG: 3D domain-containing protein [Myxococcota bacterium]
MAAGVMGVVLALACTPRRDLRQDEAWSPGDGGTGRGTTGTVPGGTGAVPPDPSGDDAAATGPSDSSGPGVSDDDGTSGGPPAGSTTGGGDETTGTPGPDTTGNDAAPGPAIGAFQLTYYWLADENDYGGAATETIYEPGCSAIATISPTFADALTLEGSGRLADGTVVNYHSPCGCPNSPCFFVADAEHPWGYGVQNRSLAPFRSIAVDTDVLSIGQAVYVAELDGVAMPGDAPWGNFVHDGCVVADDIGGGINGAHIDFYAGLEGFYTLLDGELSTGTVNLSQAGERCAYLAD